MIPDVIFSVKISSHAFKKSKRQNSDITIGFPSQKLNYTHSETNRVIEISGVLGDSGTILGRFGSP